MRKFVSTVLVAMFVLGISEICYGFEGVGELLSEQLKIPQILKNTSLNTTEQQVVAAHLMSVLGNAVGGVEVEMTEGTILMDKALYEAITGVVGIGIQAAAATGDTDQLVGVATQLGIPAQLAHEDSVGTRDMILGLLTAVQGAATQALAADEEAL